MALTEEGARLSPANSTQTKVIIALAWLFEIIGNIYAGTQTINGENNASVSRAYPTLFTPAGWAFSIWGVIFLSQGFFVIYQCFGKGHALSQTFVGAWVAAMLLGGFWSVPFAYRQLKLCLGIMAAILASLIILYRELHPWRVSVFPKLSARFWCGEMAISIHFGWICVATIVNTAVVLTDMGWNDVSQGTVEAAVAMQVIAASICVAMLYLHEDVMFASIFVWAFTAIKSGQTEATVVRMAAGIAHVLGGCIVIVCLWKTYTLWCRRGEMMEVA